MHRRKMKCILVFFAILSQFMCSLTVAETWRLDKEKADWKVVSHRPEDRYLMTVSELKRIINTGQIDAIEPVVKKLKEDFPDISGADLDIFIEAEKLYANHKFSKAVVKYEKLLTNFPESKLYDVALDREFAIARAYLAGEKKTVLKIFKIKGYAEGVRIADIIIDRVGDSPIAIKVSRAIAESFEKRGKFEDAYQRWSETSNRWPTGQIGKDALLAMARCKHAAYKGPNYDVSNLVSARSYYENFQLRYPEDAKKFDIANRLEQIREQLAHKQYSIAEYYKKTGSTESANIYCQMIADDWPDSTASKRAEKLISKPEPERGKK